MPMDIILVGCL